MTTISPSKHIHTKLIAVAMLTALTIFAARPRPHHGNQQPTRRQQTAPPKVSIDAELMITNLKVVEDPIRTNPRHGRHAVWTFRHLITSMAGDLDPAAFTLNWLQSWEHDQTINGQVTPARPAIRELVIDPWLAASGGHRLDLNKAPFKLLAIVNRIDLRSHDGTTVDTAGEGRFVFGLVQPDGTPLPPAAGTATGGFVVISEYELLATDLDELGRWANDWHELGRHPVGSPVYNDQLARITERFAGANRAPDKPNRNPLNQIRTNEVALSPAWELREFVISPTTGQLTPHTVAITPGTIEINGTTLFRDLINDNRDAILDGTFNLPADWFGASSISGPFTPASFPDFADRTFTVNPIFAEFFDAPWSAAGIADNNARHAFAVNTCNGCHRDETGTAFLHVGFPADHQLPATLGVPAELSGFLKGITLPDPVDATAQRQFNDLERRQTDLLGLLKSFGPDGRGAGPRDKRHRPHFVH